mmetsp:Transcript_3899/g.11876  ORF Transcript_3899/g.11876 Transcript_3899/m.11876 type:complete len:380 (+) Transcript_3899:1506-2645(+)
MLPVVALLGVLVGIHKALELRTSLQVAALAHHLEAVIRPDGIRLQAGKLHGRAVRQHWQRTRRGALHLPHHRSDARRGGAADARKVDLPAAGQIPHGAGDDVRALARPGGDVAPSAAGVCQGPGGAPEPPLAKAAGDAHRQRPRVPQADEEGLDALPRGRPAVAREGGGDHQRKALLPRLLDVLVDGKDRGLGVQRVDDALEGQEVRAALDQAADLLRVRGDQVVPGGAPLRAVLGARRRQQVARGADDARHEARLLHVLPRRLRRGALGRPSGGLAVVVRGALERAGPADVATRAEVLLVVGLPQLLLTPGGREDADALAQLGVEVLHDLVRADSALSDHGAGQPLPVHEALDPAGVRQASPGQRLEGFGVADHVAPQ